MRELWSASDRDLISSMTLFLPIHGRFSYLTETFIIINKNKNHKMDLLWSQACNWMWLSDTSYFLLLLHIPSYILLSLPTSSYFLIYLLWFGLVWFGKVWYGLIWFAIVLDLRGGITWLVSSYIKRCQCYSA